MQENNELDGGADLCSDSVLASIAQCLTDYLHTYGWNGQSCDVLRYLAEETESRLRQGKGVRFSTTAIYSAIRGNQAGDQSQWLSRIWNDLTSRIFSQREDGLKEFSRARGLHHYPWIAKVPSPGGAGNPALYHLEARPLPPKINLTNESPARDGIVSPRIHYIPELRPEPAWWLRWLFSQRYSGTGWRKWLGLLGPLVWILAFLGLLLVAGLVLGHDKAPLNAQHLTYFIFIIGTGAYALKLLREFGAFLDDHIALAPDFVVALREYGVCVELYRPIAAATGTPRALRLVRYAAKCPACGSQVLLERGEPDFPRRLVGRCQESPREHIFSFDRVSSRGYWLRGEELI